MRQQAASPFCHGRGKGVRVWGRQPAQAHIRRKEENMVREGEWHGGRRRDRRRDSSGIE